MKKPIRYQNPLWEMYYRFIEEPHSKWDSEMMMWCTRFNRLENFEKVWLLVRLIEHSKNSQKLEHLVYSIENRHDFYLLLHNKKIRNYHATIGWVTRDQGQLKKA